MKTTELNKEEANYLLYMTTNDCDVEVIKYFLEHENYLENYTDALLRAFYIAIEIIM